MAGANRVVRKLTFTHSGEAATLSQVVEMPEGGPLGEWNMFQRRVSGTGVGYIESIYGSFESSGDNAYQLGYSYQYWGDQLSYVRWSGEENQFPYLRVEADFEDEEEEGGSTTVEFYITCF